MKVGFLVIGSEVLSGRIKDLNTHTLAEFLRNNHLELSQTIIIKDEEHAIQESLENLFQKCDVIITSGGLGPTKDDLTKDAIATYLGRNVVFSEQAHLVANENYQRMNRPYPGKEHPYSHIPTGFTALSNSTGFAPCLYGEHLGRSLLSGPGVPREFRSFLEDHFLRLLQAKMPSQGVMKTVTVRTKRIPEEKIFKELDLTLWDKLSTLGDVSSLPVLMGVDICVTLKSANQLELNEKENKVLEIFQSSPIQPYIWQLGSQSIEQLIVGLANKKKITFGFAESCTGGLCSHRITNVSGSGNSFLGSIVSYDLSIKANLLEVNQETLAKFGAVSVETAQEMSRGLAKNFKLDIAISITGLAGPTGGTPEKPIGTVCIGVTVGGQTKAIPYHFIGDREVLKNRFSEAALTSLLEELEKFS